MYAEDVVHLSAYNEKGTALARLMHFSLYAVITVIIVICIMSLDIIFSQLLLLLLLLLYS